MIMILRLLNNAVEASKKDRTLTGRDLNLDHMQRKIQSTTIIISKTLQTSVQRVKKTPEGEEE